MADDRCDLLCLNLPLAEALRSRIPDEGAASEIAVRAAALGDATRLRVAVALASGGELCVCDLAWIVGRAENLVSHHARVLRSAGLATSRRQGKMVLYQLSSSGRRLLESVLASAADVQEVTA